MRENGGSSNESTSGTIIKRSISAVQPHGASANKCLCCPYGCHIDLGFVSYAHDISNGFISRQATPTMQNRSNTDRQLTSSLDNCVLSDSLENLMSDFEEVLAPHKDVKNFRLHSTRLNDGYSSDNIYGNGVNRPSKFDYSKNYKISRPVNDHGSRSNTPTISGKISNNNVYSTALAKTVSEIRAKNSESPFPEVSNTRMNTPIDLGVHNGINQSPSRLGRHDELPPTPTSTFRRIPHQVTSPMVSSEMSDFASLRRGREYVLPTAEPASRVRFYSASPKLQRRLKIGPSFDMESSSQFTYTQQHTGAPVLARTQSTSTSPELSISAFVPIHKPLVTRSIAVTTGPLPPIKPCSDCPKLRKELQNATNMLSMLRRDLVSVSTSTENVMQEDKSIEPQKIEVRDIGVSTIVCTLNEAFTSTEKSQPCHIEIQTDNICTTVHTASSPIQYKTIASECQTERQELISCAVNTDAVEAASSSASCAAACVDCEARKDTFTRNVGVGSCTINDKICVQCDNDLEVADENEAPGFKIQVLDQKQRDFDIAKAKAVKKLLTNEQKSNFQRGTGCSKSARFNRKKSVDDLDYIVDKNASPSIVASKATTPEVSEALMSKVFLKKEIPPMPLNESRVPEPRPTFIPRPKISKWATPEECAVTPDEQDEAQDRLTPLRSEMRTLGSRWARNGITQQLPYSPSNRHDDMSDSDAESDCSAHSDETFDMTDDGFDSAPFELSDKLREALENFNSNLLEPGSVPKDIAESSVHLVQHEWMKTAARKISRYEHVDQFVEALKNLGSRIIKEVVNIVDQNGNTALHYAVSHANFSVVSSILDCGEVDLNTPNKAGYTAVMLAALSSLEDDMERAVVQRLFEMGDVNAKAAQHGQTALMLSVSHGKQATTELLLACNADVNIQDEEGSTALMCAAEHGHKDLVKLLLSQADINASLTDCDSSTALSIALENDHRDIGVLIYAYLNYSQIDALGGPTSTI